MKDKKLNNLIFYMEITMLKKLIFCLIILNTLTVWADLYPSPNPELQLAVNEENNDSLFPTIAEKWDQITSALLAPMRQQQEKIKLQGSLNNDGRYTTALRFADFFLKECN